MGFLAPVVGAVGSAAGGIGGGLGTAFSVLSTLVGGVVSAAGQNASAQAANQQAQYQAQINDMNAQVERDNAARVRDASQIEQQQADIETDALLGQQVATQSSSGVDIGSRSSLGARKAARQIGRRDALNIRQAGELDAFNNLTEAAGLDASANLQRMAGRNALKQGRLGAFGTLIGAASSAGAKFASKYTAKG